VCSHLSESVPNIARNHEAVEVDFVVDDVEQFARIAVGGTTAMLPASPACSSLASSIASKKASQAIAIVVVMKARTAS